MQKIQKQEYTTEFKERAVKHVKEGESSLGKPVLVMRDVTERPETINSGTVRLVGADRNKIFANAAELLDGELSYKTMARAHNPYGDGHASERIIEVLKNYEP